MTDFWSKLDRELQTIYSNYLQIQEKGKENVGWIHPILRETYRLSVRMEFSGSLQAIENLGFKVTQRIDDTHARGRLQLEDLENIASSEQVIKLTFGKKGKKLLDTSVEYINARGSGNVWQFNNTTNEFSGITGKGVVIGIIDTGIDYKHPVFLADEDPKTTRIKRIWDQGVQPHDSVESPETQYLEGNDRYGAEYTEDMINDVLQGNANESSIKHKDCSGHGTHVASTAAGNGRAPKPSEPNSEYEYIGVAPEADIVVVKILDLFEEPRTPPSPGEDQGTAIGYNQQLYDAITYILKVAELDLGDKPVVINYSIGQTHGPHDGFTEQEDWLTEKFGDNDSKGLFVTSAGNAAGNEIYALATIPSGGEITIPFELYDHRTVKTSYDRCRVEGNTRDLNVDIWYKNPTSGSITPHLTLLERPELPGLALNSAIQHGNLGNNDQNYYTFIHSTETITRPAANGHPEMDVMRNNINLALKPTAKGSFKQGSYSIRITGPEDAEMHIWCEIGYGNAEPYPKPYGIKFDFPSGVTGLDVKKGDDQEHLITAPAGANNVLTVAANRDPSGIITSFSSRGPLVDYSSVGTAYIQKPDVSAPGSRIMAAESSHTDPPGKSPCCQGSSPPDYIDKGGTSMSSPHVAGMAALLLEKNDTLTTSQLINTIKTHVANTEDFPLDPDLYGSGRIDVKKAIDNTSSP